MTKWVLKSYGNRESLLIVQWLGLVLSCQAPWGSIPGWGTKISQTAGWEQTKKKSYTGIKHDLRHSAHDYNHRKQQQLKHIIEKITF